MIWDYQVQYVFSALCWRVRRSSHVLAWSAGFSVTFAHYLGKDISDALREATVAAMKLFTRIPEFNISYSQVESIQVVPGVDVPSNLPQKTKTSYISEAPGSHWASYTLTSMTVWLDQTSIHVNKQWDLWNSVLWTDGMRWGQTWVMKPELWKPNAPWFNRLYLLWSSGGEGGWWDLEFTIPEATLKKIRPAASFGPTCEKHFQTQQQIKRSWKICRKTQGEI